MPNYSTINSQPHTTKRTTAWICACGGMAAYVKGSLLCWYSVFRQPELLLIKVTKVENIIQLIRVTESWD